MKNLIKKILEEKDFIIDENILEDENRFLATRTANKKFDFFTVMFINKDEVKSEFIKEKIEDSLLKIISSQHNFVGIEKNLSLLLIMEVSSLQNSKEITSLIYDIEEDPYDFKKYVLSYTKQQLSLLESYRGTKTEGHIIPFLNSFLNNSTIFSEFKNNEESEDVLIYDLVSKLFIKIPFLNLENNQKTTTNLYEDIVDGIEEQDKNLRTSLLKLNETVGSDPGIEEILKCIGVDIIE